jgi:GT2 family glycosyltransferase
LKRLSFDKRLKGRIAFENTAGLPVIYNKYLDAPDASEILVFMHDDVWIDDYFFVDRIITAMNCCDIMGVAGNRRRIPRQPSWAFIAQMQDKFVWDAPENLSGHVAHGKAPFGKVADFGATPAECELLDGVLLAARRDSLRSRNVRFDPRFDFHFYDLDFCRSARAAGLVLVCDKLALTHLSKDAFGSAEWQHNYALYLQKWGE